MGTIRIGLIVFTSLCIVLACSVSAWALRCHGRIVSIGDRRYDVVTKCGEPTYIDVREEDYAGHYIHGPPVFGARDGIYTVPLLIERITYEEWTYDFGPHRLIYYLRFEKGILKNIKTGFYGHLQ